MRTTTATHTTQTERRAMNHMKQQGIQDARIGRKEYHIRGEYCHIVENRKPMGLIGESKEIIITVHKMKA